MTAFTCESFEKNDYRLIFEIRSVNSRNLDLVMALPQIYQVYELEVRKTVAKYIKRGRVELRVKRIALSSASLLQKFDRTSLEAYLENFAELEKAGFVASSDRSQLVLNLITRQDLYYQDPSSVNSSEKDFLLISLEKILASHNMIRKQEGDATISLLATELENILGELQKISSNLVEYKQQIASKLEERISTITAIQSAITKERLAEELAVLVQKADFTEEFERALLHTKKIKTLLSLETLGKELEFSLQELNREVNTLSVKAQSFNFSSIVVSIKCSIERIKEQSFNLE